MLHEKLLSEIQIVPAYVQQRFSTSNYIKYCMHESHMDWKGSGGVALWHPLPISDDRKLIKGLVTGAGFSLTG